MTTASSIELSYDASARFKRTLLKRLSIILAILIVAQIAWTLVGERISSRVLLLFWQRQCLNYEQLPGRLMYVWVPPTQVLPSHLQNITPQWEKNAYLAGAMPCPIELAEMQAKLSGQSAAMFQQTAAPVYLHKITDSKGNEKLLTVYVICNNPQTWWTVCTVVQDLATWTTNPAAPKISTATWPMPIGPTKLLVLAGQTDPKDASSFSIPITINGEHLTVTGKANTDGSVQITSSSGLDPADRKFTGELLLPQKPKAPPDYEGILLPTDD